MTETNNILWFLDGNTDIVEDHKVIIASALRIKDELEKLVSEEEGKHVGSCDQHDTEHCSDCEVWFTLQRLIRSGKNV